MQRLLKSFAMCAVLVSTASSACLSEAEIIARDAPIALLVDLQSGQTLFGQHEDRRFVPASITKVMSVFVAFDMIKAGKLSENQSLSMSEAAADDWYRTGSTMFLEPGEAVSVEQLLRGMTSVSANDASVVLAEGALGSVSNWVARMNETALDLGMKQSRFGTPNGWPDGGQTFSTATDLAKLGQALIARHPDLYARYFGLSGMRHNGFAQANHDPISGVVRGADGIKTGYTSQAGNGFLGSAERDGTRLMLVLGAVESEPERARMARMLIEWGFDQFERRSLFDKGDSVGTARVQNGEKAQIGLVAMGSVTAALPVNSAETVEINVKYEGPLQAPVVAGETVAHLQIKVPGMPIAQVPLAAESDVAEAGPLKRIANAFDSWIG